MIKATLSGRLRNTTLSASHALLPLYEAIINSIHAIEDRKIEDGRITVTIKRHSTGVLSQESRPGRSPQPDITDFIIEDNGIGFTDENYESFTTLDSEHKLSRGGRGIGRLLWLKAFSRVEIDSTYSDNDEWKQRNFSFSSKTGVTESKPASADSETCRTQVSLHGFKEKYRKAGPKGTDAIASHVIDHCLWFFVRPGGAPDIYIRDDSDGATCHLNTLFESQMHANATTTPVEIHGIPHDLLHVRMYASHSKDHIVCYCANGRVVKEEKINGKIDGLNGPLTDTDGEDFYYHCYVQSDYLNEHVRPERTDFDIAEEMQELWQDKLSFSALRRFVYEQCGKHLEPFTTEVKQLSRQRVEEFVTNKAPMYRTVLKYANGKIDRIDPKADDRELDLKLYQIYQGIEYDLREEGASLLSPKDDEEYDTYWQRVEEYFAKAQDVKQSDLARYVCHRKAILDFMQMSLERKADGKYHPEDRIHEIIFKMREDSDSVSIDDHDLWIIDERLVFHHYLCSDKSISSMPITGSNSRKEPDIAALNVFGNPVVFSETEQPPHGSLAIVEFKKPMRGGFADGEEKNPIDQVYGYIRRIRAGKVQTKSGRPISNASTIPAYAYVICDLTDSLKERCENANLTPSIDSMGYFGFNAQHQTYIEVISDDKLIQDAKKRNESFFRKLGLPSHL
jgi:hypothetical protein